MRLVDDDGEPPILEAGKFLDAVQHKGKGLDGDDDNGLGVHERLGKLGGLHPFLGDSAYHAFLMLELVNRILKLGIEDCPVGNHDHAIKYLAVGSVVQARQTMGDPRNGIGFAGTGTVLD